MRKRPFKREKPGVGREITRRVNLKAGLPVALKRGQYLKGGRSGGTFTTLVKQKRKEKDRTYSQGGRTTLSHGFWRGVQLGSTAAGNRRRRGHYKTRI